MAFQSVVRAILPRLRVSPSNFSPVQIRLLSTSQVNCSGGPSFKHILNHNDLSDDTKKQIESEVRDTLKDWLPYGWNETDKYDDIYKYKVGTFIMTVIVTFGFAYQMWYRPRGLENEWARREAFLELERRRLLGLPLVDPNLIPPERVKLPSKEELGPDYKIII
uniref:NADH dehydrogenase [ubiquinone] 1 beta subcomplex subunit 11, mitochondrial n=1 Tax=Schistocephalus solidus TaxID=70667 RepID=A0A0X3NN76_SCHSO